MKSLLMILLILAVGAGLGWEACLHLRPLSSPTAEECSGLMKDALGDTVRQGAAWAGEKLNRLAGKE